MTRAGVARLLAMTCMIAACHHARAVDSDDVPHIDAVRPDSVLVPRGGVVEVRIVGRGFAPGQPGMNTVEFAGMSLTKVPANTSGTELRLTIPDMVALGSESPPTQLESGTYTLRVKTSAGASNPVMIRVFR